MAGIFKNIPNANRSTTRSIWVKLLWKASARQLAAQLKHVEFSKKMDYLRISQNKSMPFACKVDQCADIILIGDGVIGVTPLAILEGGFGGVHRRGEIEHEICLHI